MPQSKINIALKCFPYSFWKKNPQFFGNKTFYNNAFNILFLQFHLAPFSPLLFHCSAQSCEFSAYYPKKIDYMYLPCLRLLIATGVVLFHNPSQTSPNCPCPSLRTNFKLPRSISHWSRVECDKSAVTGFSICKKREKREWERCNVYYTFKNFHLVQHTYFIRTINIF